MPPSSPRDASMTTLSQFCYHVLYLKHWFCPGGRTFDPWTEMCTECPTVLGCLTCLNSTYCSVCYESLGYFPTGTGTCQLCSVTGCTTCTTDANTCSICDATLNYVLTTPTCLLCDSTANMFANTTSQTCQSCAVADCLNCSTLTTCAICDLANLYYVGPD